MSIFIGGNGNDSLSGEAGEDILSGGNGSDTLDGGAGSDLLLGGNGNDTLDGSAGNDVVFGENGNDTAVYAMSENLGDFDFYDGGRGTDRLRLLLTQSQLNSASVQADLAAYQAFLSSNSDAAFQFTAFNLTARDFEQVEIVVVPEDNQPPADIALSNSTIAENSANGTVVGALSAADPDAGETFTFTLLDDAGGRFAILGADIVVAGSLDFESATSHQITVRVTDASGAFYDEIFTINVTDVAGALIVGDNNVNTLVGTPEGDTIQGLGGDDRLTGGGGNDLIDGGAGFDRAAYTDATGAITANLAAGTVSGAGIGIDTLQSIERIRGSDFADTFNATGFSGGSTNAGSSGTLNEFEGMGGDDTIIGNGNTRVSYLLATAAVTVDLVAGTGIGDASVGTDHFTGVNAVRASAFDDTLLGNALNNNFEGRAGDDFIDGAGGFDIARYLLDDEITSGIAIMLASGVVTGDASIGTDTLRSIEFVIGTNFADVFDATGFSGSSLNAGSSGTFNQFEGRGGDDTIIGNGNTQIGYFSATAGVTVDLLAGTSSGNSSVGNDSLSGVNAVIGSGFADTLLGSDSLALPGERFAPGAGNDFVDGRGGVDILSYVAEATAGIHVQLAAGTVTGNASVGVDTIRSIESVAGSNFDDVFDATGFDGFSVNAGSQGTQNSFTGNSGNDTVIGNGSTMLFYGNATAGITIDYVAGTVTGNASVGTDTFSGVGNIAMSNFADTAIGDNGTQSLHAGDGDDMIHGNGGFDVLFGGDGDDTINGGADIDQLFGGSGDDTFVFAAGNQTDVIDDFIAGAGTEDRIDLTGVSSVHSLADLAMTDDGSHTTIDFGGGDVIMLNDVVVSELHNDDFLFS